MSMYFCEECQLNVDDDYNPMTLRFGQYMCDTCDMEAEELLEEAANDRQEDKGSEA